MKVKSSTYLHQVKPLLKELLDSLLKKYRYVSILASDSKAMNYSVSKRGTTISENEMMSGRGFVTKIYDGNSYGEYSFNDISKETLSEIIAQIENSLMPLKEALPSAIDVISYAELNDEEFTCNESTEYQKSLSEMGSESIIALLTSISEEGRNYHSSVIDCAANLVFQEYHKLFLSPKKDMEQNVMWTTGSIAVMVTRGEEIKYSYKGYSHLGGGEIADDMKNGLKEVADAALALLDSQPIVPGEYECVCTPEVTGMIVHEAFGHGVEMDMFVKKRALAESYIGEYVASPLITMHDGGSAAAETGSYFFDDEGILAKDTIIIEKGILKRGISDSQSAMYLGTEPTGNGRRQSYERKAYTRMTNTFFEEGDAKVEDMIASIKYGFLLADPSSGMEDPKNWGIQCMVNVAKEIKDGKLTGRIFSPIVLTGYVPDLLKSISMVSDKTVLGGGGMCGKGYKEWVKVSDGGPYIKAKIRLG